MAALQAICERSTRDSLEHLFRGKTCRSALGDWRAVFERREERRWVAQIGPSPPCPGVQFLTFIPEEPIREGSWVVAGKPIEKRVVTNPTSAPAKKRATNVTRRCRVWPKL